MDALGCMLWIEESSILELAVVYSPLVHCASWMASFPQTEFKVN